MTEKTQIKFVKSKETDELISFVSRLPKTKKLNGVRENSQFGKKICVLAEHLKGIIQTDVLYDVELKAMYNKNGYIVVSATPALFEAQMETIIVPKAVYKVNIVFGYKHVIFDPKDGKSPSYRSIDAIIELLNERVDLKHKEEVITDFKKRAQLILNQMKVDGYIVKQ
ncbi:hypothetical protein DW228_06695 [Bacteroides fragilis]|uniref:Uncharacterized protein n=1 Tax=Bacteroides fragilis TaxID=817 RepID=A0A396C6Y8_BACFG|nr:hypothetical protein [Bacteroides fragilis]RHH14482.1 hypothetical protein DW228_06695 [Bacteroides fragilis]